METERSYGVFKMVEADVPPKVRQSMEKASKGIFDANISNGTSPYHERLANILRLSPQQQQKRIEAAAEILNPPSQTTTVPIQESSPNIDNHETPTPQVSTEGDVNETSLNNGTNNNSQPLENHSAQSSIPTQQKTDTEADQPNKVEEEKEVTETPQTSFQTSVKEDITNQVTTNQEPSKINPEVPNDTTKAIITKDQSNKTNPEPTPPISSEIIENDWDEEYDQTLSPQDEAEYQQYLEEYYNEPNNHDISDLNKVSEYQTIEVENEQPEIIDLNKVKTQSDAFLGDELANIEIDSNQVVDFPQNTQSIPSETIKPEPTPIINGEKKEP